MSNTNKTYKEPRMAEIIKHIATKYNLDFMEVATGLKAKFPELYNKEICANCGASMLMYKYTLDCLDALLIFGMGKIVKARIKEGIPFNKANQIHLQSTLNRYYSVPSRSTQCSKLGLIAKVKRTNGVHDQKAGWAITSRGFAFLAGETVPKYVTVFRNIIQEHHEEVTTIDFAFNEHKENIKGKSKIKTDYTGEINTFKKEDWYEVAGISAGTLF